MLNVDQLQQVLQPLFPGLMGVQLTEATPERVVATMRVRPDLCTAGGILHGGAHMAFADTLGAGDVEGGELAPRLSDAFQAGIEAALP